MAHAFDQLELRAGDAGCQVVGRSHRDQGVGQTMQHQGRQLDTTQLRGAPGVGGDRHQLPGETLRAIAAPDGIRTDLPQPGFRSRISRAADQAEQAVVMIDQAIQVIRIGGPGQQGSADLQGRTRQTARTAVRHHQGQAANPLGVVQSQLLGNHAAHRSAADMSAFQAQRGEDAGRIVGHVAEAVGAAHRPAGQPLQRGQGQIGRPQPVEILAQADVPVVEADDPKALVQHLLHQPPMPGCQLHAQAHDQQQRLTRRLAQVFDLDRDAVGRNLHCQWLPLR